MAGGPVFFAPPCIYIPSAIKTCALFLIITLAVLGRYLYFLHQWKEKGILYMKVNKIYHFILKPGFHYPI